MYTYLQSAGDETGFTRASLALAYSRRIMNLPRFLLVSLVLSLVPCASTTGRAADFKYVRQGSPQDVQTHPEAGVAMMGGGTDLDEAFRWLCAKANGGDFLIVRAHGSVDYNPYVGGLC